ncbi:uncharacterized protein LOC110447363 [Mizuhopecten yessoensis]|uniref:Uncharacterized protein n=1 Tax=Mizuhopecten yessoensis TaxID=6573 RepID=A0A210QVI6_MIZYE|nr:uncharacterized protein LOC110447363 [Mizuhopecten yessoensis]OWF52750.1 hypothetical protein KP79_PYT06332 [Mizuhopecten yessoensis]
MTTLVQLAVLCVLVGVSVGVLVPLDDFSTKSLDTLVRKKLMFMIVHQVNQTVEIQDTLKHQCEVKINQSITQCNTCAQSHNAPPPANVLGVLLPTLMQPVVLAAGLVKDIEGSLESAVNVLGDKTADFVNDVGSVAKNAGNSLIGGVSDITKDALHGLSTFGDQLAGLAGDLGHGLETAVHGLESGTIDFGNSIGSGLDSIGDQLTHGAQGALDGINSLGHEIEHVGSSVGHAISNIGHSIGSIFGKRSACPICDKLNTKTRTPDEILNDVCGANELHRQRAATALLTKMKAIYDTAIKQAIVTKVEYDPASIDVTSGVAFKTVYVTYTITSESRRYQSQVPLRITALPVTGDALGQEIFNR